jgi:hypothetical protein
LRLRDAELVLKRIFLARAGPTIDGPEFGQPVRPANLLYKSRGKGLSPVIRRAERS